MASAMLRIYGPAIGEESTLASRLHQMYCKYAESQDWSIDQFRTIASGCGPMEEVAAVHFRGTDVLRKLRYESGVHRFQWVSTKEQQGRVSTVKLSVAVTPGKDAENVSCSAAHQSDVIRTYNIPLNRVTDHRFGLTMHGLDRILNGSLDALIQALESKTGQATDDSV